MRVKRGESSEGKREPKRELSTMTRNSRTRSSLISEVRVTSSKD